MSATTSATSSAAASAQGTSSTNAAATSTNALTALSDNFNDFLSLLTTQLQNQDPTSPLDTSQFTSELVQFTGVEQQIDTNTSLTSLIQATQGEEVIQATGVVGKSVVVTSPNMVLQNGAGSINFTTTTAEPLDIAVYNSGGTKLSDASLTSVAGSNTWTWNGETTGGVQEPDGVYQVVVTAAGANGATSSVPFTVNGTATGVTNTNGAVSLNIGALSVDFSAIQSVGQ